MVESCPLQSIDNAISQLTYIKQYMDDIFRNLDGSSQSTVDKKIEETINPLINKKLAEIRESTLISLQGTFKSFEVLQSIFEPLSSMNPTDLTKVIEFCQMVKKILLGSFEQLISIMTILPTHVANLSSAITEIISYSPPSPPPGINYDKLNIEMEPITMGDITGQS